MFTRRLFTATAAVSLFFLAACGGGGGGDSGSNPPVTTFSLQSAFRAYTLAGATVNYSITGTCTGTATITDAAAVVSSFEGVSGYSVSEAITFTFTTCTPASSAATGTTYYDSNFTPLGSSVPGEEYAKFQTALPPLPTSVSVGDTAQYGTLILYTDSTKTTTTGTRLLSYVVESDTSSSAIVNLISRGYDTSNRLLYTQQSRYRISAAGMLSPVSIDIQYSTTSTIRLLLTRT